MTAPVTRRGFLGAGALLTMSLALPERADAPTIVQPSDAELWAILDRPHWGNWVEPCFCGDCTRGRAGAYECAACGFSGVPVVYPCTCESQWREFTEQNARMLASPTLSPKLRGEIQPWQQQMLDAGPPPLCTPPKIMCAHTATMCPACGDCGDDTAFEGSEDAQNVGKMLRDLRAVLRARGTAPT